MGKIWKNHQPQKFLYSSSNSLVGLVEFSHLQRCDPNEQKTHDAVSDSFLWHLYASWRHVFFRENWARFWPVDSPHFQDQKRFHQGSAEWLRLDTSIFMIVMAVQWSQLTFMFFIGVGTTNQFHLCPQFSRWQPSHDRCVESRRLPREAQRIHQREASCQGQQSKVARGYLQVN